MKLRFIRGFSLIEVLITMGILAAGIVFIFRSFAASLAGVKLSQNITNACLLSEAKLWELSQRYRDGFSFLEQGSDELEIKKFDWNLKLTDVGITGLKQINFNISWPEGAREYSMDFSTFVYKKQQP